MNKEVRITVRLTPEQYESIRARADTAQLSPSAYIRAAAMRHRITVVEGLPECTGALKAIGRNINQLTMLAHQGRVTAPKLDGLVEELAAVYDKVAALADREDR